MNYLKEAIIGLWTATLQWGINRISDFVFKLKKAEAIGLCQQYNCKYYVIQSGYFNWVVLRARDIDFYKKRGELKKDLTALELSKTAAFVADPYHINFKGGKK